VGELEGAAQRWQLIVANAADGCASKILTKDSYQVPGLIGQHKIMAQSGERQGWPKSHGPITAPRFGNQVEETFVQMASEWRGEVYPFGEALLVPAVRAVEQAGPGGCNHGFLRQDAMLHVVLVSDAATPYEGWLQRLQAVKKDPGLVRRGARACVALDRL
jgi:hypothetical protein